MIQEGKWMPESYLALDNRAPLKELSDDLVVLGGAELRLELALGSAVHHALVALPVGEKHCQRRCSRTTAVLPGNEVCLLVGDEDLEAADDLGEGHALVLLPVLDGLLAVGEDHEVVLGALEVDLDLGGVSAHDGGCVCGMRWWWWVVEVVGGELR